jgi:hypothetical protein
MLWKTHADKAFVRMGRYMYAKSEGWVWSMGSSGKLALESLPGIYLTNEAGDLGAILRVNGAGRRYLIDVGI